MIERLPLILALLLTLACATSPTVTDAPPAAPRPDAAEESAGEESAEAAEVYRNFLRWSTAMEEENFGYEVFRGESEDGPFERISEKTILGAGTTDQPSHYEFVDEGVDPYKTYWYYVESISMAGERERFSPIVKKAPKLPREPEKESEGESDKPSS